MLTPGSASSSTAESDSVGFIDWLDLQSGFFGGYLKIADHTAWPDHLPSGNQKRF
jgi:hypothetical protein